MRFRLLAGLILAAAALPASAETYKWVDAKGQVNYSNAPPPSSAKKAQPVEERISVMGLDPGVRAAAERRFAARERANEIDWRLKQQARAMQARYNTPAYGSSSRYLSPYGSSYYPGMYYPGSTYAGPFLAPAFFTAPRAFGHSHSRFR